MRLSTLTRHASMRASSILVLAVLLLNPQASADSFQPPEGTVVSPTAGVLITEGALWSLLGNGQADVGYTSDPIAPSLRHGMIITVGDGSDFGSRRMLFEPVTVYPSCWWYERGTCDGRAVTVTFWDYMAMGGKLPVMIGADWCRWLGMDPQIKGLYKEYKGAQCYRLVENFPPGQSYASVNQAALLKIEQANAEQWCFQLELMCSLIPGVNTAVTLTEYPIMSREVISAFVSDGATIIPGALVLKGGRVLALSYVKGSFVAANLGMGAYDFQQANNNQDRILALLNLAGGCLDAADTLRSTKCGTKFQRPAHGARPQRLFDNLVGDEVMAAKGAVNPLSGAPIPHLDSPIIGVKQSTAHWERTDLPRKSPLIKDVRQYLQVYVSTLPVELQAKILKSGEWRMIMNSTYSPKMVFATPDYKAVPLTTGTFQFEDWTGGAYLRTKSGERIIFVNPNWPDDMILVTAFHESLHAWRYVNPKGRAKDKLVTTAEMFSNSPLFWKENQRMMISEEALTQMGSAQFYSQLKKWGMQFEGDVSIEPLDIVAIIKQHSKPGDLRMQEIGEYLLAPGTGHHYAFLTRQQCDEVWGNLKSYCKDYSNWKNISDDPGNPVGRFEAFNKAYFYDVVDLTAP